MCVPANERKYCKLGSIYTKWQQHPVSILRRVFKLDGQFMKPEKVIKILSGYLKKNKYAGTIHLSKHLCIHIFISQIFLYLNILMGMLF